MRGDDRFPAPRAHTQDESARYVPVVEEIARALIKQLTTCTPRSSDPAYGACDWAFRPK
jgi:hypothetical protein